METQNIQITSMPTISVISTDNKGDGRKDKRTAEEIRAWIISYLADLLEVEPDEIDATIPFNRYGLDSAVAIGMTGDLEDWLSCELDPTLLYDYPTIDALAWHLAEEFQTEA